jgi:metal-responsive CopG/Arc/MetJ family transcriptional regulator
MGVILHNMKTAVTIPDAVFQAAELLAKRKGLSRSQLYAQAVSAYLCDHRHDNVTELLNQVYGPEGEDSQIDPAISDLQRRSLPKDIW